MDICTKCSSVFSITKIVKVVDNFYCEKCIGSVQFNLLTLNKFEDFDYELSKKKLSQLTDELGKLTNKIKLYENTFGISPVYMTCFPNDKKCKSYLIFQYLNLMPLQSVAILKPFILHYRRIQLLQVQFIVLKT
jgi:hypothetical protein